MTAPRCAPPDWFQVHGGRGSVRCLSCSGRRGDTRERDLRRAPLGCEVWELETRVSRAKRVFTRPEREAQNGSLR